MTYENVTLVQHRVIDGSDFRCFCVVNRIYDASVPTL